MRTGYISINTILEDYIDFSGDDQQIPESIILKIANDTLSKIVTGDNYEFRIARLDVKDFQATLPKGFKSVIQAMYKDRSSRPVTRNEIIEYKQKIWGSECELNISIDCPNCHKEECNCNSDTVIVEVDRIWQDTHPELYASKKYLNNFGRLGEIKDNPCQQFRLMKRTSNNFFNAPYHIEGCENINFDSDVEYDIVPPRMIVNIKEGEVLLSYLSEVLDSVGYKMIPDHPRVSEAIRSALDSAITWKQYLRTGDPKVRDMHLLADKKKVENIIMARSAIRVPDYDQWVQFLQNHWKKMIPYSLDRSEANLNRFENDRYSYPKF